jgi:hypothetical protein
MNRVKTLLAAAFGLALSFTLSCSGDDGTDGKSCIVLEQAAGSGFDVICGDIKVGELKNGLNGTNGANGVDGTSCTVQAKEPATVGYDVVCGGITVGQLANGANGANGTNGTSCYVEDAGVNYIMKCGGVKKAEWPKAMCEAEPYDPKAHICSGGTLKRSCGGAPYDETKQFCDTRDIKIYAFSKIGEQTWMTEDLTHGTGKYTWAETATACPSGWKLPSKEDFDELTDGVTTVNGLVEKGFPAEASSSWWIGTESETDIDYAYRLRINSSGNVFIYTQDKTLLESVRCIKE